MIKIHSIDILITNESLKCSQLVNLFIFYHRADHPDLDLVRGPCLRELHHDHLVPQLKFQENINEGDKLH